MAEQPSSSSSAATTPAASQSKMEEKDAAHKQEQTPKEQQPLEDAPELAPIPSKSWSPPLPKKRNLPQWLNHFNRRDVTATLRCTIAVWVASLLIVIHPSLARLGQATFLASMAIYLVPPAGNLVVCIIGSLSLVLGMCLAWAWGLATMKAAQSVRSPQQTKALLQALQQRVIAQAQATGSNKTALIAQEIVHDGFMLDARITAVYFVMSCIFIYFLCRIRYAAVKTVLVQIFGIITIDMFLLVGPTLTAWTPKLAEVVVLPVASGVAISIVCAIVIFPQSTNHQALGKIQDMLALLLHPIETARQQLTAASPDDIQNVERLIKTKRRVLNLYAQLQPSMAFMPLDVSRGRWSGDDVESVYKKFQHILVAVSALLNVQVARNLAHKSTTDDGPDAQAKLHNYYPVSNYENGSNPPPRRERCAAPANSHLLNALISPARAIGDDALRDALRGSSAAVLNTTVEAICHLVEALQIVNSNRWWTSKSATTRLADLIQESKQICADLARARQACIADITDAGLQIHGNLFYAEGILKEQAKGESKALTDLITAFVMEEHMITTSLAFENMTTFVAQLFEKRRQSQFWGPLKVRNLWSWATSSSKQTSPPVIAGEGVEDPDRIQQQTRDAQQRLQVVYAGQGIPMKHRNLLTRAVVGTFGWLTNAGGLYALRVVAVTIATAIPAVIPHSAGFFYREKGIWTVVTAQTCILIYMADFTFSIFTRAAATIFGGLVGLVVWYIGSGNGPGNPYGICAAIFLGIFIFMWARLWLPQCYLQATALGAATFALIIGYSWDMNHLVVYGLPGVGYVAFWKRLVTVLIGFVAALIVQMLPSPPSGTIHVAKSLANTLHQLNDHYAMLVSHWGRSDPNGELRGVRSVISSTTLGVGERLSALSDPILMLRFESTTSPFDRNTLHKIQELLMRMNEQLSKLMLAATTLPMKHQKRLIENSGILDDMSIDNVMCVLSIAKHSLRSGAPLPDRLPAPLLQTCYGEYCAKHKPAQLHRDYIGSEDFRRYCVALSLYLSFLYSADELVAVLKTAVGESHIVFDWGGNAEEA